MTGIALCEDERHYFLVFFGFEVYDMGIIIIFAQCIKHLWVWMKEKNNRRQSEYHAVY